MIEHTIQNLDTGEFYSESQYLEDEALCAGKEWKHTSILPLFAKRYKRRTEALRRLRELSVIRRNQYTKKSLKPSGWRNSLNRNLSA